MWCLLLLYRPRTSSLQSWSNNLILGADNQIANHNDRTCRRNKPWRNEGWRCLCLFSRGKPEFSTWAQPPYNGSFLGKLIIIGRLLKLCRERDRKFQRSRRAAGLHVKIALEKTWHKRIQACRKASTKISTNDKGLQVGKWH